KMHRLPAIACRCEFANSPPTSQQRLRTVWRREQPGYRLRAFTHFGATLRRSELARNGDDDQCEGDGEDESHCSLSASMASTRDARNAGTAFAASATIASTANAEPKLTTSSGSTKSTLDSA